MTEQAVVIAGGGPTGMMLAAELALAKVDVAVVERRPDHVLVGSRAGGFHSRTIEMLDQRGIADRFLAEGQVAQAASFGTTVLDMSDFPTRHPYSLGIWQNQIERIMAAWIAELPVRIYYGCEVKGFAQGVPCAPNPEADTGTGIVVPEVSPLPSMPGTFEGSGNYTPPSTGAYTMCGWLIRYDALAANGRGSVTASSSTQLEVRAPNIGLSLSLPRPALAGRSFVLDVHATSEVTREIVVERAPSHGHGCPVNRAASRTEHLLDTEIDGGPRTQHIDVGPLPAGHYTFCAWADPPTDNGLDPQASTRLNTTVSRPARRRARRQHGSRPGSARCPDFAACQHGGGPFSP
jgi:hypothetical protein